MGIFWVRLLTMLVVYWTYLKMSLYRWLANVLNMGKVTVMPTYIQITYQYGTETYHCRIPKRRGPSTYTQITCQASDGSWNRDVSKELAPLLGPQGNFHGIPTTPRLLGYASLRVSYLNDNYKVFGSDEVLML
jgi:uncharacterized protein DUF5772